VPFDRDTRAVVVVEKTVMPVAARVELSVRTAVDDKTPLSYVPEHKIWFKLETAPPAGRLCERLIAKVATFATMRVTEPVAPAARSQEGSKETLTKRGPAGVLATDE